MTRAPYKYKRHGLWRYEFLSIGKKRIEKVVDFVFLQGNIVNLAFGDLLPDGSIDDLVSSNNGDIIKIFATIIDIVRDFTNRHPGIQIYFEGSTPERTKLYGRILKNYYATFVKEFAIAGFSVIKGEVVIRPIDMKIETEYLGFYIKRIS
jgi:hypothetical protein